MNPIPNEPIKIPTSKQIEINAVFPMNPKSSKYIGSQHIVE